MRLIHTADLHLDARTNTHLSEEKAKERRDELLGTFRRIVAFSEENEVEAILISGDLFDRASVSKLAKSVVQNEMRNHPGIRFFVLTGNHDDCELFPEGEAPENVTVFSDTFTSYDLSPLVTVTGAKKSEGDSAFFDRLSLAEDRINIVMVHGQLSPSGNASDRDLIPISLLKNRSIDYLALGHIHTFSATEIDRRGVAVYPGCPEGRGSDECGEKGFVLLDVDEEEHAVDFRFVPFALRTIHAVEIDVTRCTSTAEVLALLEENLRAIPQKDLVKAVLTGEVDAEAEIDALYLENALKDRFYDFRVKDQSVAAIDPEKYKHDRTLKGEFVRTVLQEDLSEEEKALILRTGFRALAGELS